MKSVLTVDKLAFYRGEVINLLRSTNRNNIELLIDYLENKSDYFTAPASTKYHGDYPGGLLEHSYKVYESSLKLLEVYDKIVIPRESVIIAALLHDLCKCNTYEIEKKNGKWNDAGEWDDKCGWSLKDTYVYNDTFPLGHSEKSIIILQMFIMLTADEILAINNHMGGFDARFRDHRFASAVKNAMAKSPFSTILHMADLGEAYGLSTAR